MHVFARPSPKREASATGRRSPDGIVAADSPQPSGKDLTAASAPPTPRGRSASRTSPERDADGAPPMPKPKRTGSFGLGLGLSQLAHAVTRTKSQSGEAAPATSTPAPPPGLLAFTPVTQQTSTTGGMGPPMTPDASHLGHFSLRLSELVNRALQPCVATGAATTTTAAVGATAKNAVVNAATPASVAPALASIVYDGRKLPSRARVEELADLVVGELRYAAAIDSYLLRAASRQALKSLTLFADRLESLIVSPMRDPSVLFVPTTAKEGTHLPPALEYNLGLASLTWIVEDALERCIEGDGMRAAAMPHFVADILAPVRTKMENTILHVVQPVLASVKLCLSACVAKAVPRPFHAADGTPGVERSPPSAAASNGSPSISTPSTDWQRDFEARLDGCRRLLFHRIAQRTGKDGEGWFISVAIHVIWKGLLALTSRPMPLPWAVLARGSGSAPSYHQAFANAAAAEANKRSPSPAQLSSALKAVSSAVGRQKRGDSVASSGRSTPAVTAGLAEPSSGGLPRTPQTLVASVKATANQVADLQAFERLMLRFVAGYTDKTPAAAAAAADDDARSISSDSSDDDEDELARAALAEALQAIRSVIVVAQYLDSHPNEILDSIARPRGRSGAATTPATPSALPTDVSRASKAIPPLLLLHLVYACMPLELPSFAASDDAPAPVPSPPALFGLRWPEYDKALAGFGAGQTWALACARGWKEGIESAWVDAAEREAEASRALEAKEQASQPPTPAAEGGNTTHELERTRSDAAAPAAGSPTDSEVSLPEAMTQSAPALESLRIADSRPTTPGASTATVKGKAWGMASFRRSKLGTTSNANSPPGTSAGGPSSKPQSPAASRQGSPDRSPELTPTGVAAPAPAPPAAPSGAAALKFWRSNGSQARRGGAGHKPPSLSLHNNDDGLSEARLALERARQEKSALRLLARASEAVANGAGDAGLEVVLV